MPTERTCPACQTPEPDGAFVRCGNCGAALPPIAGGVVVREGEGRPSGPPDRGVVRMDTVVIGAGWQQVSRRIRVLKHGRAARGRITRVGIDTANAVNGHHPIRLDYRFETPEGRREGSMSAWDPIAESFEPGEPTWVLYLPDSPDQSTLWPPLH